MKTSLAPLDLKKVKVQPLAKRQSLVALEKVLVDPNQSPTSCSAAELSVIRECADRIQAAQKEKASVILVFGASLVLDGLQAIVNRLVERGFVTHLATDGTGIIHDWELAFLGHTGESPDNIATGTLGMWEETARNIHLALLNGALSGLGFGQCVGKFIEDDGVKLPSPLTLEKDLREAPSHPLAPARAELLRAMTAQKISGGRIAAKHLHKDSSLAANAFRLGVPFTVHPSIGADALATHPMFRGAVIGRAADFDFRLFGSSVERLEAGVVLAVNPPDNTPQVLETALSCVNNLRLQSGKSVIQGHTVFPISAKNGSSWENLLRQSGRPHHYQMTSATFIQNIARALAE